jgi:hypothetical protein
MNEERLEESRKRWLPPLGHTQFGTIITPAALRPFTFAPECVINPLGLTITYFREDEAFN